MYLHRICKRLKVPVPERGYWAKLRSGGKTEKKPLPKFAGNDQIVIYRWENSDLKRLQVQTAQFDFLDSDERQRVLGICQSIEVDNYSTKLHPLTAKVHHKVSQSSKDRAERIIDTLLRTFDKLGFPVSFEDKTNNVSIRGEKVRFTITELSHRMEHQKTPQELKDKYAYIPPYDFVPSGEISLIIDDWDAKQKSWNDGKRQKVENCIGEFVIGLIKTAEINRIQTENRRRGEQIRQEEERRQRELEKQRKHEKKRFEQLEKDADDWRRAQRIRAYTEAVEANQERLQSDPEQREKLKNWVRWAKEKADWLDPLTAKNDPVFGARHSWGIEQEKEDDEY